MKEKQIKEMILDIIGAVDYDIAKNYDEETAEEPEYVEENMQILIAIVEKHLKKQSKKK